MWEKEWKTKQFSQVRESVEIDQDVYIANISNPVIFSLKKYGVSFSCATLDHHQKCLGGNSVTDLQYSTSRKRHMEINSRIVTTVVRFGEIVVLIKYY